MANTKISALPTGTIAGTDTVPVVKAGVTTAVPFSHTHPQSDITGLTTTLAAKALQSDMTTAQSNIATLQSQVQAIQAPTPLDQSTWTWDNQGGASVSQVTNGAVLLKAPNSASDSWRVRYTAAPATPYTITALVRCRYRSVSLNVEQGGIALRDATGKLEFWYVSSANQRQHVQWTNATTFSAVGAVNDVMIIAGQLVWLRIKDEGATGTSSLIFSSSIDGENFEQNGTEARTAFFGSGPTQIGIALNTTGGTGDVGLSVLSWVIS